MGRAKNFIKKANKSIKDFREKAKKPREPITTKASMFSIISWAFYDLGNTIFSVLIVSFYFGLWVECVDTTTAMNKRCKDLGILGNLVME